MTEKRHTECLALMDEDRCIALDGLCDNALTRAGECINR